MMFVTKENKLLLSLFISNLLLIPYEKMKHISFHFPGQKCSLEKPSEGKKRKAKAKKEKAFSFLTFPVFKKEKKS